jgi:hypothetical protein
MRSPLRRERPNALGREEVLDDRAECGRVGEQVDVAAGVCVWRVACGSSRAMMWALMIGMIGSSVPATMRVGWRIAGRANRLDHTDPASSWYR